MHDIKGDISFIGHTVVVALFSPMTILYPIVKISAFPATNFIMGREGFLAGRSVHSHRRGF